ncbi:MAG: polyprenol phosphomannose-dependent alpha 1,6 mannosyltransferase MptB [Mycobacteriales bacterium]|nr:polyprenol phosphomannose-dependent alpha 1,6 mannosyltransferase MptB [Mycobacteriales bacterium]
MTAASPSAAVDVERLALRPARLRTDPVIRLGLLGTVLLSLASWARGPYRAPGPLDDVPVLGWLRMTHPGRTLSTVVFYVGIVVLVTAWLRLGRRMTPHDAPPTAWLWRVGALWGAPLLVGLPLASRDVYSYLAQGQLALSGLDPYTQGPAYLPGPLLDAVSTTWWLTPAPYGPGFLIIAEEVSRVSGGGVLVGVAVMRLLAVVSLVALAVLVRRLARSVGVDPARATWLALLNPLVLVHLLGGLHNEVLIVPLVLAGFALALGRHPLLGAGVIALAAAVKVTAVVALPFVAVLWVLHRRQADAPGHATRHAPGHVRTLLGAFVAVGAVGTSVLTALSVLSGYGFTWLTAIGESTSHGSRLSVTSMIGTPVGEVAAWVGGLRAGDRAESLVHLAALALAAWLCVLLLLRRVVSADQVLLRCGLAMVAVAVLGPVFHPWYLLPGLALVAVGGAGVRTTTAMVWTTLVLAVLVRPGGSEVLRPEYPFDLAVAALALLAIAVVKRRDEAPATVTVPVTLPA